MKLKQKILNITAAAVLTIYPFALSVPVYADISLPNSPDSPSLPGEQPATGTATETTTTSETPTTEATSSNTDTGSDSTNTADTSIDSDTDTMIDNEAEIDNLVDGEAVSGENTADSNTGDGTVNAGDASISSSLETTANTVSLGDLECSTDCADVSIGSLESSNSETGSDSTNNASTTNNSDNSTNIENDGNLNNWASFDATSGDNSTSDNTGNGTITTGDSEIILTAINTANNIDVGYEVFNVYDDQTGDIVIDFNNISDSIGTFGDTAASNSETGSDSENNASITSDTTNSLVVDNNGDITNTYILDADSGNNTADDNTGDGSITTGDANVVFNLINFLNNTFFGAGELLLGVVNIFGTLSGDIILQGLDGGTPLTLYGGDYSASNSTTGSDSDNDASVDSDNDTNIALNNDATVLNNVVVDANTGDNTASDNTGSGTITTGDVDLNLNVANIANTNTFGSGGGTIWMVLVNNLGTWTGQLFGLNSSAGVYSPFFTFTLNPDGSFSAINDTTGSGSENNASTSMDNDTDIAINNTGAVTNNVMIDANTGGNSASRNTGSGTINTGDANVAANILNILNNNFIGGRFALTIVNIFGKFLGDIREGGVGGPISVDSNDSIAISPSGVSNQGFSGYSTKQSGGITSNSSNDGQDEDSDDSDLITGSTNNTETQGLSISRFGADRGLLDDFKLYYLIIPIVFGTALTLVRRALLR